MRLLQQVETKPGQRLRLLEMPPVIGPIDLPYRAVEHLERWFTMWVSPDRSSGSDCVGASAPLRYIGAERSPRRPIRRDAV